MILQEFKDKAENLISQFEDLLNEIPEKGNAASECQRVFLKQQLNELGYAVNGTREKDMVEWEFNNSCLTGDEELLNTYDNRITVAKAQDTNLEVQYAIDVEDGSYFYDNEQKRDEDYDKLRILMPKFYYMD